LAIWLAARKSHWAEAMLLGYGLGERKYIQHLIFACNIISLSGIGGRADTAMNVRHIANAFGLYASLF
jgi:hypothetical protein